MDNEDFFIVDWRNKDGSSDYAVRYILDKKKGSFIVYDDLGDSVANWYSSVKPAEFATYIDDIHYYIRKISTGDIRWHDEELAIEELISDRDEQTKTMFEEDCEPGDIRKTEDDFNKMIELIKDGCSVYDEHFVDLYTEYYIDSDPGDLGKYINHRPFLWAAGYILACEQLGMIEIEREE